MQLLPLVAAAVVIASVVPADAQTATPGSSTAKQCWDTYLNTVRDMTAAPHARSGAGSKTGGPELPMTAGSTPRSSPDDPVGTVVPVPKSSTTATATRPPGMPSC